MRPRELHVRWPARGTRDSDSRARDALGWWCLATRGDISATLDHGDLFPQWARASSPVSDPGSHCRRSWQALSPAPLPDEGIVPGSIAVAVAVGGWCQATSTAPSSSTLSSASVEPETVAETVERAPACAPEKTCPILFHSSLARLSRSLYPPRHPPPMLHTAY